MFVVSLLISVFAASAAAFISALAAALFVMFALLSIAASFAAFAASISAIAPALSMLAATVAASLKLEARIPGLVFIFSSLISITAKAKYLSFSRSFK